jgi:hypothetical protein
MTFNFLYREISITIRHKRHDRRNTRRGVPRRYDLDMLLTSLSGLVALLVLAWVAS